jgi:hypothetical protein
VVCLAVLKNIDVTSIHSGRADMFSGRVLLFDRPNSFVEEGAIHWKERSSLGMEIGL